MIPRILNNISHTNSFHAISVIGTCEESKCDCLHVMELIQIRANVNILERLIMNIIVGCTTKSLTYPYLPVPAQAHFLCPLWNMLQQILSLGKCFYTQTEHRIERHQSRLSLHHRQGPTIILVDE